MTSLALGARSTARRPRPGRTWRTLKMWLPLTIALALAGAGLVALAISAIRAIDEAIPVEVHEALGHHHDAAGAGASSAAPVHAAPAADAHAGHEAAAFPANVPVAVIQPPAARQPASVLALAQSLTRSTHGAVGQDVDVLFATADYLHGSGQHALAETYQPERYLVFFVAETLHAGELPPPPRPVLVLDGTQAIFAEPPRVLTDSVHHRTTVAQFARVDTAGAPVDLSSATSLELYLPGGEHSAPKVRWDLPLRPVEASAAGRSGFSAGPVLALLGGLLAAMWPCLFQLTAYFIPSIAGLSMVDAQTTQPAAVRARVLRTALLFVSGIVVVYTLAGAAAGYAVQTPGARSFFEEWRRPLAIAGALIIGAMAVRMALRARAPMVCHMPIFSPIERLGRSPLGTMLLGVAFATGCMTCFGAALTLGTFTYVASMGSVLAGAATLFVFALGFAVPLVIGSLFMARVLPFLERLQRFVPALTLASSAVMLGFAVLLLTDQYHIVSDHIARLVTSG